jgi:transposase
VQVTTVGVDLAKRVFQVHGVDVGGRVVVRKHLSRGQLKAYFSALPPALVGMEACASSHYWARVLAGYGHQVRLISPHWVKPYRKGNKNDGNDAAAICEAVGRPGMRFVPVQSPAQQAVLMLHRVRSRLMAERTALINQIRGLLAEYGIVLRQGASELRRALPGILEDAENGLPDLAREVFADLYAQLVAAEERIAEYEQRNRRLFDTSEPCQRLAQLDGVGPLTATAFVATVGDARVFRNGRQLAAWLGLTPREHSSGGKHRRLGITKRGDVYLRTLLIHGARAMLRLTPKREDAKSRWVENVRRRAHVNVAAVALAAKHARILWALLARQEDYCPARG